MEELIAGLVVAALGGLAYIAYRHPEGYAKLYLPLLIVLMTAIVGAAVWNASNEMAALSLIQAVPGDKLAAAQKAVKARAIPNGIVVFGGMMLLWAYLIFLSVLPNILGRPKSDRKR